MFQKFINPVGANPTHHESTQLLMTNYHFTLLCVGFFRDCLENSRHSNYNPNDLAAIITSYLGCSTLSLKLRSPDDTSITAHSCKTVLFSIDKQLESIKIILTKSDCNFYMYKNGGYYIQLGIVCIPKFCPNDIVLTKPKLPNIEFEKYFVDNCNKITTVYSMCLMLDHLKKRKYQFTDVTTSKPKPNSNLNTQKTQTKQSKQSQSNSENNGSSSINITSDINNNKKMLSTYIAKNTHIYFVKFSKSPLLNNKTDLECSISRDTVFPLYQCINFENGVGNNYNYNSNNCACNCKQKMNDKTKSQERNLNKDEGKKLQKKKENFGIKITPKKSKAKYNYNNCDSNVSINKNNGHFWLHFMYNENNIYLDDMSASDKLKKSPVCLSIDFEKYFYYLAFSSKCCTCPADVKGFRFQVEFVHKI